jgi:hypothetical protein
MTSHFLGCQLYVVFLKQFGLIKLSELKGEGVVGLIRVALVEGDGF